MTRRAWNEQLGTFLFGSFPVAVLLGWGLTAEGMSALLTSGEHRFAVPRLVFAAAVAGTLALGVAGLVGPDRLHRGIFAQRLALLLLLAGVGSATPLIVLLPLVAVGNPAALLAGAAAALPIGFGIYHARRLWPSLVPTGDVPDAELASSE